MPVVPALQQLSDDLCVWNKEVFGNLLRRKRKAWARLEGVQKRLTEGGRRHLLKLEAKLRKELNVILKEIEHFWFKKSIVEAIGTVIGIPSTFISVPPSAVVSTA